jgi:hypothetical protein
MQFLKNKHLILAMFVAPTLAIIAYFGVDYVVSEKPQAALPGKSYKLAAKSDCRYQSGSCILENGDIEVHLRAERIDENRVGLTLSSVTPIQNALISFVTEGAESEPVLIAKKPDTADAWYVILPLDKPEQSSLRLVLNIAGSMYYAETTAIFVDYMTSFSRENFQN